MMDRGLMSHRGRGTEEYGQRWWNEHIFQENTLYSSLCLSGLKQKMGKNTHTHTLAQMCQPCFQSFKKKKKSSEEICVYVQNCMSDC